MFFLKKRNFREDFRENGRKFRENLTKFLFSRKLKSHFRPNHIHRREVGPIKFFEPLKEKLCLLLFPGPIDRGDFFSASLPSRPDLRWGFGTLAISFFEKMWHCFAQGFDINCVIQSGFFIARLTQPPYIKPVLIRKKYCLWKITHETHRNHGKRPKSSQLICYSMFT